jgi:Mg2+-importing ATPase
VGGSVGELSAARGSPGELSTARASRGASVAAAKSAVVESATSCPWMERTVVIEAQDCLNFAQSTTNHSSDGTARTDGHGSRLSSPLAPRSTLMPTKPTARDEIGLTSTEAALRLAQFGPNDPIPKTRRSHLTELLLQFANPLVAILLLASAVSAFVGEIVNAAIVLVIVTLSVAVNFVQTFRSQKAADGLRATVAPTATVLRDGAFADIPRVGVVPGDLVRLAAGDLVPADARLVVAKDLHVQESALTGESMPVAKDAIVGDETSATLVLLGTSVVSGTATARVLATGPKTAFGDIATRLRGRAPETEFDRGIKQFGSLIMKAVFGLVMFILVVRIGTHRSAFESVLFAVALAVGLTPEFLPMITSVTLARGAVAMSKHKVIVKHLSAIQNLGSIDVLCSDKTGTLTRGIMKLDSSCDALGGTSTRVLFFARLNSKFETGIRSPLDWV